MELLKFARETDLADLPFVKMWILQLIAQRPDLCDAKEAMALADTGTKVLGVRPLAMMARAYRQLDWVRAKKEIWSNHEPWDRCAVIFTSSVLPSGEKRPFLTMVAEQGDVLDAAVAKFLLSHN